MSDPTMSPSEVAMQLVEAKNPGEFLLTRYRDHIELALNASQITGALAFEPFLAAVKDDLLRDRMSGKGDLWRAFQSAPDTAMSALTRAAQCKLLPGSAYGLFYLIPRRDRGRLTVNGQLGYRGLATMVTRHPRVHSAEAFLVYEGEEFDFNPGTGSLHHRYDPRIDRDVTPVVCGYSKVIITEPNSHHAIVDKPIFHTLTWREIEKRRACSDAWRYAESSKKKDSPWHLWPTEMARKTLMIAGLNNGSVPRDMGVGAVLDADMQDDLAKPRSLPTPSRTASLKQSIGIVEKLPNFDFAEEAVAFIRQAATLQDMEAAADRWQHFQGSDAESIAVAFADREAELGGHGV